MKQVGGGVQQRRREGLGVQATGGQARIGGDLDQSPGAVQCGGQRAGAVRHGAGPLLASRPEHRGHALRGDLPAEPDDLDRQRVADAESLGVLLGLGDDHEAAARIAQDLLVEQGAAATLQELQVGVDLVGPVDDHRDLDVRRQAHDLHADVAGRGIGGARGDRRAQRDAVGPALPERRDDRRREPRERRRTPPEPTDDERDRRTVFVQQLAARLRTQQLIDFFSQVGPVKEAQIVKDRVSNRSKGVGYVEFRSEESVEKALQLTGQKLLGIPIIAQLTEAEKNRQARNTEGVATLSNGIPFHRLYVGNIHFSITEEDLRTIFEPFGALEFCQLQKEEQGRSKGYGFVQ